jgi:hypothetical protein
MFLDPRYTRLQDQEDHPQAVGVRVLFTTLPDAFFSDSNHASVETADRASKVSVMRFGCRLMQNCAAERQVE